MSHKVNALPPPSTMCSKYTVLSTISAPLIQKLLLCWFVAFHGHGCVFIEHFPAQKWL